MGHTLAELEAAAQAMTERIVERFDPEQVILFGSVARGDVHPDSDVDLLVVMPFEGPRREKRIEVAVALDDVAALVPRDVFLVAPDDLAARRELVGTLERPACEEGRSLYARAA
jgi:predicted nucleotidyltransferase